MVAPLLVFIIGLALYPTGVTIAESFFRVDPLTGPSRFAGIQNFRDIFSIPTIRESVLNTALYIVFGVALTVIIGTCFALLLQRKFRVRAAFLAIVILPWALPGVVEGVIWSWIYDPNFGVLNSVLKSLGLIQHYKLWVGSSHISSIFLTSLVQVWQITPLATLLVLASLQAIPGELYEAARVDGAGRWESIRRITLPLARPGLAIATAEALVMSLNIFDQVYVLNGAATTGESLMTTTYYITFQDLNFGEGYAISLLATIATVVLAAVALKVLYRKVEF
jgi:multiple sugar transport system permease protein